MTDTYLGILGTLKSGGFDDFEGEQKTGDLRLAEAIDRLVRSNMLTNDKRCDLWENYLQRLRARMATIGIK